KISEFGGERPADFARPGGQLEEERALDVGGGMETRGELEVAALEGPARFEQGEDVEGVRFGPPFIRHRRSRSPRAGCRTARASCRGSSAGCRSPARSG